MVKEKQKTQIEKIYEMKSLKELDKWYSTYLNDEKNKLKNVKTTEIRFGKTVKRNQGYIEIERDNHKRKIEGLENNKDLLRFGYINSKDIVKDLNTTDKLVLLFAGLSKGGKKEIYGQNSKHFRYYGVPKNFTDKTNLTYKLPGYLSLEGIKIIKKMNELYKTLPSYKNHDYDKNYYYKDAKLIDSCAGFYLKRAYDMILNVSKYSHYIGLNLEKILKIKKITEENVKYLVFNDKSDNHTISEILEIGKRVINNPVKYDSEDCKKELQKALNKNEYDDIILSINKDDEIYISSKTPKMKEARRRTDNFELFKKEKEEKRNNKIKKNDNNNIVYNNNMKLIKPSKRILDEYDRTKERILLKIEEQERIEFKIEGGDTN